MDREEKINHIIKTFKNIGERTAPQILDAGIETLDDLKKLGAEEAFYNIWAANPEEVEINAMYLYALEGAIQECNCLMIGENRKQQLQQYAQALRESI